MSFIFFEIFEFYENRANLSIAYSKLRNTSKVFKAINACNVSNILFIQSEIGNIIGRKLTHSIIISNESQLIANLIAFPFNVIPILNLCS